MDSKMKLESIPKVIKHQSCEKYHVNYEKSCFLMCKNMQLHRKTQMFEGFAGCVRERKMYF